LNYLRVRLVDKSEIPDLTEELDEGFVDLCLKIDGLVRDRDGVQRFEARALHNGRTVAFAVALGTSWRPLEGAPEKFYYGEARLVSLVMKVTPLFRFLTSCMKPRSVLCA
jgi:hypothetical protein